MGQARILAVTSDSSVTIPDPLGALAARKFELVADYAFAAPGGAARLVLFDLPPGDDTPAFPDQPGTSATVFTQLSPPTGWLGEAGPSTGALPVGAAVLFVIMDVDEDALDLFHGWYDEEHLPAMVKVPGVDAARRFHATAGAGAPAGRQRFLALYEVAATDVFHGPEWDAVSTVTPRTAEVMPHVSWASQLYRRAR